MDTSCLNWIVLKVTQLCNLNCTYCYVYNRGDDSWRTRPKFVTDDVIRKLCERIREYCELNDLKSFTIEFHGGEPLLLGIDRFEGILAEVRKQLQEIRVRYLLQTNGLLLDREWVEWLYDNDIRFGISIDGPSLIADSQRVFHSGRGTTEQLLKTIVELRSTCPRFAEHNPACLCVVNPDIDGGELIRWFYDNGFRAVDLLLPDGSIANLPHPWHGPEAYTRFLISAFDEWRSLPAPGLSVRKFETILSSHLGIPHGLDSLGGDLRALCVVETDGGITLSDVARMCGGKFASDSLNIFSDSLGCHVPYFELESLQKPCEKCRNCSQFSACGGGYLPHRYDGRSFDNPSLYCESLFALAEHARRVLIDELNGVF